MQHYKALISDLDGTLIPNRADGLPSQRNIDAVNKAKEKIHVSIATGRAPWQAGPILDALQLSGPVILLNGALIVDGITKKPLYKQPLLEEDFDTVVTLLRKTSFRFIIDNTERTYEDNPDIRPPTPLTIFIWDLLDAQANILMRELAHIPTLSLYKVNGWKPGTVGLNISHKMATKQYAVLELAKLLKVETHELIGIGEGPNDFPLLMACGFKVAMGNAVPDLKAIADYIAAPVEEDGVAQVIEQFVLNNKS